jgi:predicted GH43/DUF377 family glycosyl hydrolase
VTTTAPDLVRRTAVRIEHDPSRVVSRLFVPGQSSFEHQESRAAAVVRRILALDDAEVERLVSDLDQRFTNRHRDLHEVYHRHAAELADRLGSNVISPARRLLLGAAFTSEYAVEGAALCNPSIMAHPDQTGVRRGALRIVMSVRAVGEGHQSSIGFRTGTVEADGTTTVDPTPPFASTGVTEEAELHAVVFRAELDRLGHDGESADYVLDALGSRFSSADLDRQLAVLQRNLATRGQGSRTMEDIRTIASRTYGARFAPHLPLAERVLCPTMGAECRGMEDARFVRFTEEDGQQTYLASYTAYDGRDISQQLLQTSDFEHFTSSPLVGPAAANKGLALFPRRIGGRYAALSRADRESNSVSYSDDLRHWGAMHPCQSPTDPWEMLQLGNCGSPIETDAGWLVLTHGVGPMRVYSIGAILCDLDDPTRVVGRLRTPLLTPTPAEQDGYVPNVVYSCGSLVHGGTLVVPYGIGDASIGVATVPLTGLLEALQASTA